MPTRPTLFPTYEPGAGVWGLWNEKTPVGLMAMIKPGEGNSPNDPFRQRPDDPTAAYLWRLMIDADYQGQGHGGAALAFAVDQTRACGLRRLTAHVSHAAHSNLPFCQHFGFLNTGVIEGDELIIVLDL